jgi:hypothetical protein
MLLRASLVGGVQVTTGANKQISVIPQQGGAAASSFAGFQGIKV